MDTLSAVALLARLDKALQDVPQTPLVVSTWFDDTSDYEHHWCTDIGVTTEGNRLFDDVANLGSIDGEFPSPHAAAYAWCFAAAPQLLREARDMIAAFVNDAAIAAARDALDVTAQRARADERA